MKWLWGEKKQEITPMNIDSKEYPNAIIRQKVKVHHELDIEYPRGENIAQVLRDIQYDLKLPPAVKVHGGDITYVEVYSEKQ